MRWYARNKEDLVVNYGYASSVVEGYQDDVPLFERKRRTERPTPPKRQGREGGTGERK